MPISPFRTIAVTRGTGSDISTLLTHRLDDETSQGIWSTAPETEIVFADHNRDGNAISYYGGAIAGAAGGTPVQLLFWGSWWSQEQEGKDLAGQLQDAVQTLLGLRYWSGLTQYGIPHAPVFRGATTVISPAPPTNGDQAASALMDMVDDLIDEGTLPDPDDGRLAIIAFMPKGFKETNAQGAHGDDYDFDFPWTDPDRFWAGWVSYKGNVDDTMQVFSHELVEMLTDPEQDAWHTERSTVSNEISDAAGSPAPGETPFTRNRTDQTAYIAGVKVQGYFSNQHALPIIPVEPHYQAQLTAVVQERSRQLDQEGTYRPKALLGGCVKDRDYGWTTYAIEQSVAVSLNDTGFHSAAVSGTGTGWTLNGQPVRDSSGSLTLRVLVAARVGRDLVRQPGMITIDYQADDMSLQLDVQKPAGSFDLEIGATVIDTAIEGNVLTQPTAHPQVTVGITASELVEDPEYVKQFESCLKELTKRYTEQFRPVGRSRVGGPPHVDFGTLTQDLPAFVSTASYQRIQLAKRAIRAAQATTGRGEANELAKQLVEDIPELSAYVGFARVAADLETQIAANLPS